MIVRILTAYHVELVKALRTKYTYAGPLLIIVAVLVSAAGHRVQRDAVGDYGFIAFSTPMALNLLGLLLLLAYCAGLISSELGRGTIRNALVRPIHRGEFLLAKFLLGATYAIVLTAVTAAAAWGVAYVFGDLSGVSYGGEVIFTNSEMRNIYIVCAALSLLPQFGAVAFALCVSACTRSTGAAVGGSVGLWIVVDIVKEPLGFGRYLFSSHLEAAWKVFAGRCDALDMAWWPGGQWIVATSIPAIAVFLLVAWLVLTRRNLGT